LVTFEFKCRGRKRKRRIAPWKVERGLKEGGNRGNVMLERKEKGVPDHLETGRWVGKIVRGSILTSIMPA